MKDNIKIDVNSAPGTETIFIKYQEPREYILQGTRYQLRSTQAVIDLINKRGSAESTQIFYVDSDIPKVQVILNDTISDRDKDLAVYSFEHSGDLAEWEEILNDWIDQKTFINFLKRRDVLVEFPEVMGIQAAVQQLKMATQITGDYSYDDRNNYTFAIKVNDMEGTTRMPNIFEIHIPILNESDLIMDVDIELEIGKPKEPGQKPAFLLTCPKLSRYIKESVTHEIDKIKAALPDYNIMAGSIN